MPAAEPLRLTIAIALIRRSVIIGGDREGKREDKNDVEQRGCNSRMFECVMP
jgi:hypothetical protein